MTLTQSTVFCLLKFAGNSNHIQLSQNGYFVLNGKKPLILQIQSNSSSEEPQVLFPLGITNDHNLGFLSLPLFSFRWDRHGHKSVLHIKENRLVYFLEGIFLIVILLYIKMFLIKLVETSLFLLS